MAWKCYSCGTKNPNKADTCSQCGGNVAAPRSFYIGWVFGGGLIFMLFYLAGTFLGSVIIETMATPKDEQILEQLKASQKPGDPPIKSLLELKPDQITAARAVATEKAKAEMSTVFRHVITWIFPALLFVLSGVIVGFMSDGRTVIEAGAGAALGQVLGCALHVFVFKTDIGWLSLAIGVVPLAAVGVAGAWLGEVFQLRKEMAA